MNAKQTTESNLNAVTEERLSDFPHRSNTTIEHSAPELMAIITMLMNQFDENNKEGVNNETLFYGVMAVKSGINDLSSYISIAKRDQLTEVSTIVESTISSTKELILKTKDSLDILRDQFASDNKKGCLDDQVLISILKSIRKRVVKIENDAAEFIEAIEKQQT